MARPRIFVSSTYYDLKYIRGGLEAFTRMAFRVVSKNVTDNVSSADLSRNTRPQSRAIRTFHSKKPINRPHHCPLYRTLGHRAAGDRARVRGWLPFRRQSPRGSS
jgi:hypothetical protein